MKELIQNHKLLLFGSIFGLLFLSAGTLAASTSGVGADKPPEEKKRGTSTRSGGHFLFFHTGGGYGQSARGVKGRGFAGGGPGRGK